MKIPMIASLCVTLLASSPLIANVLSTDFDTGVPSQFTGQISLESVDAFAGLGLPGNQFGGQFLRNDGIGNPAPATVLTLTDLPNHVSVDLKFLLGIINTWDGFGNDWGPDSFNVRVDGTTVFSEVFALRSGSTDYNPPAGVYLGDVHASNPLWGSWLWCSGYDMGLEPSFLGIPHSASTLTVEFFGSGPNYSQDSRDESWAIDNLQVSLTVPEFTLVSIDIKPGSDPNSINLGSNGNIPVAIFGTDTFDVTTVDPATIMLADAGVKARGKKGDLMSSFEDVNEDGLLDLLIHIDTQSLVLSDDDVEALLTGETFDGLSISGTDAIRIVGSSGGQSIDAFTSEDAPLLAASAVPEPSTAVLLCMGAVGLTVFGSRGRRRVL